MRLSGFELMPRRDYLAAVQRSQQACAEALSGPQLDCTAVLLPPPRVRPIYQTRDGRSFALAPGAAAPRAVPFLPGSPAEIANTGGFEGGFLALSDSPKLRTPREPASPLGWVGNYFSAAPSYADYAQRQPRWSGASAALKAAVSSVTDPRADEWRQSWFGGIRSAAAARTPIYESGAAVPLGASFFAARPAWGQDEYHQAFFAAGRDAAAATRGRLAPLLGSAPATMFAPGGAGGSFASGALRDTSAFGELGGMLLDRAGGVLADMLSGSLQAIIQDKLAALAGGGSTFENLRGALGALGTGGCFGGGAGADLGGMSGTDGCFGGGGDLAGMLDGLSDKLAGQALGMLKDAVFNSLWTVDDRSSAAEAVAHKYAQELADKYGEAFLSDPQGTIDSIKQKLVDLLVGASSSACVMMGLAYPNPAPLVVQIHGLPATRLDDLCEMPKAPDVGPFIMGNPTVLINGMPASGDVHIAVGKHKGTVAVPMVISANVLMGMATVTVDPPPQGEAPAESGAGATEGGEGGSAGAEGGGGGAARGENATAEADSASTDGGGGDSANSDAQSSQDGGPPQSGADREGGMCELPPPSEDEGGLCEMPSSATGAADTPPQPPSGPKEYETMAVTGELGAGPYTVTGGDLYIRDPDSGQVYHYTFAGHGPSLNLGPSMSQTCGTVTLNNPAELDGQTCYSAEASIGLGVGPTYSYSWGHGACAELAGSGGGAATVGGGAALQETTYNYHGPATPPPNICFR